MSYATISQPQTYPAASKLDYRMVKLLILKDWYLQRYTIIGSLVGAVVAFAITILAGKAGFYLGVLLLITVLIAAGAQLVMSTTVQERKEQNVAFIMSLPISSREFTAAKILANMLIFLGPWLLILTGSLCILLFAPGGTRGLVPFVAIMATEILVSTCLILVVAITTESQGWTIAAIMVGNLAFNVLGYMAAHIPGIAKVMYGPRVVWNDAAVIFLLAEFAALALLLTGAFVIQARKTDYL